VKLQTQTISELTILDIADGSGSKQEDDFDAYMSSVSQSIKVSYIVDIWISFHANLDDAFLLQNEQIRKLDLALAEMQEEERRLVDLIELSTSALDRIPVSK
jgi:hypothetical protein